MATATATQKVKVSTPKPTNGHKPINTDSRLIGRVYNGIGIGTWQKNITLLTWYFVNLIGLDLNIIVNGAEVKSTGNIRYKASKTTLATKFDISETVSNDVGSSWNTSNTIILNSQVYNDYKASLIAQDLTYSKVNHAIHSMNDTLIEILALKYKVKSSKFYDNKVFTTAFETVLEQEKLPIQVNIIGDKKVSLGINHISKLTSEFEKFANSLDSWEFATTSTKAKTKDTSESTLVTLSCNRKALKTLDDGTTEQTNKKLHKFSITLDKSDINASIKKLTCLIDIKTGKSKSEICGTKLELNK